MSRLMEYFNEVDKNAALRAAHHAEPLASMSRFGLSSKECAAVMSGDARQLAGAVGIDSAKVGQFQVVHVPQAIVN